MFRIFCPDIEAPQAFFEQVNTMLAGYARVSTLDQNPGLQLDALSAAGCERIFEDRASGARSGRAGLAEALDWMRKGDTLVVWKLDRLGRSLPQLVATIRELEERGFGLAVEQSEKNAKCLQQKAMKASAAMQSCAYSSGE